MTTTSRPSSALSRASAAACSAPDGSPSGPTRTGSPGIGSPRSCAKACASASGWGPFSPAKGFSTDTERPLRRNSAAKPAHNAVLPAPLWSDATSRVGMVSKQSSAGIGRSDYIRRRHAHQAASRPLSFALRRVRLPFVRACHLPNHTHHTDRSSAAKLRPPVSPRRLYVNLP